MVVADQDHINLLEFRDRACRFTVSERADESRRRASVGEDGVDDEVIFPDLDESC